MVCFSERMHSNGAGHIENKQWILTFMYCSIRCMHWHLLTTSKMFIFHVFEFTSEKRIIVKMNEPEYIQLKREAVKCAFCS